MNALQFRRQMRQESTPAERKLWDALRAKRFCNIKFRRQHTLDKYTVDFYCATAKLIIEIDGAVHHDTGQELYDIERDSTLKNLGYQILRFSNDEIFQSHESTLHAIEASIKRINR